MKKSVLLIDNYDSFTYNVMHALGECGVILGQNLTIVRNDEIPTAQAIDGRYDAIVISPGPGTPTRAGICMEVIKNAPHIPILGICLGMQAMVESYGGKIVVQTPPKHGKVYEITHHSAGILNGLTDGFAATRYHSLVADEQTFPASCTIDARCADGTIMAISHHRNPHYGVQFHPESIRTIEGGKIFANFINNT